MQTLISYADGNYNVGQFIKTEKGTEDNLLL